MSTDARPVRVGVLSLHNSKETKAILNAVEALGHEPVWLREENATVDLSDDREGSRFDPDVDVVINRLLLTNEDHVVENLELANVYAAARPLLNSPAAVLTAIHKYAAEMHLDEAGVPTPDSFLALTADAYDEWRDDVSGDVIQKANVGTHGESAWRVDDDDTVHPTVGYRRTFLQRYLDRDGEQSDVRAYVVGDRVLGAMRRTAGEDDWRTNVAQEGGAVEDATDELPDRVFELAREAADAVGLDVAGVDLMCSDGEWRVIEVNPTAGFRGFFDATGVSPAPHIARLAIERAGGDIDDELVDVLETSLDDSVPDSRPDPARNEPGDTTVGYTETVTLNAPEGPVEVEARVDTGAARTSIGVDLAAEIEAGPIRSSANVRSAGGSSSTRPLVDVEFAVEGGWRSVTASVEDRSNMNYDMLLGRDVLDAYTFELSSDGADAPSEE